MKTPSYRLHKASGKAVVTINYRDHYLGEYGTRDSKRAYEKMILEWKASSQAVSFGHHKHEITVAMLLIDYLAHCDEYYPKSNANEAEQTRCACKFLAPYMTLPVSQFKALKLKAVRQAMLYHVGKHERKLSRTYINKCIGRIRRMFRWGVENELVENGTYQELMAVKGLGIGRTSAPEAPKVKPVSDAAVNTTIVHCTKVIADMIRLQQYTGARPGEVCYMTLSMIDKSGPIWTAVLPEHKTAYRGQSRIVYLGPQAQALLMPYLDRVGDAAIFSPREADQQRRDKRRADRKSPDSCGNKPGTNRAATPKKCLARSTQPKAMARPSATRARKRLFASSGSADPRTCFCFH